ncbi:TraV family lipoprotein [Novosphingobium sp. NBM11]|jgi:conjugal transfer pilus assembly protein TraV|uniref:TraV family lipoprotein n=1 Tax=Sphingomonadaceae TaxID=41297 RepID=UPI0009DEE17A|nr:MULTISPECIES: TraV family lipoprotein [Sphingomonadaceae]MBF5089126.1 TraV family lipoprotein [Novosphingobium sp. NBM11]MDH7970724.1 TraV family lipoprotein [Sphingomonas sp. AR_OL41]
MPRTLSCKVSIRGHRLLLIPVIAALGGCATLGSVMSPYSEKYSCKNSDHGQCVHPEKAYEDAVAGRPSRSDPAVTNDKKLLRGQAAAPAMSGMTAKGAAAPVGAYLGYKDSVYRELQGLIDQPVTPMLKPPRTVRTLILPYADRQRPDRLYMPRYVFSIVETPAWVVGDYLVDPVQPSTQAPVLGQVQEREIDGAISATALAPPARDPRTLVPAPMNARPLAPTPRASSTLGPAPKDQSK